MNSNDERIKRYSTLRSNEEEELLFVMPEHTSAMESFSGFWHSFKEISAVALPTIGTSTLAFTQVATTFLLDKINDEQTSGEAKALILMALNVCALGISPLFAMSILANNKIGELRLATMASEPERILLAKRQEISMINRNGLYLSTMMTLPVTAALFFSERLLTLAGQDEAVASMVGDFLRPLSPAVLAWMVGAASEQMLLSFGHTKKTMGMALAGFGAGLGLAILLGFGGLGIEKFGAPGVAIGFASGAYLSAAVYILYLLKSSHFKDYEFFSLFSKKEGQWDQFKRLIQVAGSITLSAASQTALWMSANILPIFNGSNQTKAMTCLDPAILVSNMIVTKSGQAVSRMMGEGIGIRDYENTSLLGKHGAIITCFLGMLIPIVFSIAPYWLITGTSSDELEALLKELAPIMLASVLINAGLLTLEQQLKVFGDLKGSAIVSLTGLGQTITAASLVCLKTKLQDLGIGICYLTGLTLTMSVLAWRWANRIKPEDIQTNALTAWPSTPVSSSPYSFFSSGSSLATGPGSQRRSYYGTDLNDNTHRHVPSWMTLE